MRRSAVDASSLYILAPASLNTNTTAALDEYTRTLVDLRFLRFSVSLDRFRFLHFHKMHHKHV